MSSRDLTILRTLLIFPGLPLLFLSQVYWFMSGWRLASRAKWPPARIVLRLSCLAVWGLLCAGMFLDFRVRPGVRGLPWRSSMVTAFIGLWLTSGLFGYVGVKLVALATWTWERLRRLSGGASASVPATADRRRFLRATSVVAAGLPFASSLYGFAFVRLHYRVFESQLQVPGLPAALSGMRIAQLSDIHMGDYMSAAEVRRAVDMANELKADLAVVTGDFITRPGDPLESCIAELSRLQAPLGVWGCNGNHEGFAHVEGVTPGLFARYGMRLLRQQSARLAWNGQPFLLHGVDYESTRDVARGRHPLMAAIQPNVRREMPNILLAHNPNCFRHAAELGIEVMLTGHTHGGQVAVEILDHRFSPARFLTPYVQGLYRRPMGASQQLTDEQAWSADAPGDGASVVYVNRGLGTIGMPVRLGVPPEITIHTLIAADPR